MQAPRAIGRPALRGRAVALLALFASVFGFGCYLTLLGRIGADRAAYASVVFPVLALGLSSLFEGFQWTILALAGVALIVLGNVIVLARFDARRGVNRG